MIGYAERYFDTSEREDDLIVAIKEWEGTPFHPGASLKGVGVDCIHLAQRLYVAAGLFDEEPLPLWQPGASKHTHASQLHDWLEQSPHFIKGDFAQRRFGDLVTFRIGNAAFHCGVMMGDNRFFHVIERGGTMANTLADSTWHRRLDALWIPVTPEGQA